MNAIDLSDVQVLLLMNDKRHIHFVSDFLKKNDATPIPFELTQDLDENEIIERVNSYAQVQSKFRTVVSSEVFNYKLDRMPDFLARLRKIVGKNQIILLHPSKVHQDDRVSIKNAAQEPFKALQGHDLQSDPQTDLLVILQN